jgi:tungstate transport system ATP-binding protein
LTSPLYDIRDLAHAYAGRTVLSVNQLSIRETSILGLMGPNGSGKSTLLRLLGFVERPLKGWILFKGRPAEPFSAEVRFQVTLLPQDPYVMKRSVFKNIVYGLELRGDSSDVRGRVHEALSMVGLSAEAFVRRPWSALSGGEAQRVALAARLALKPKVLLLDEPTASVDAASAQLIKDASLRARDRWGTTLIIASHDRQWLHEVCDEVIHLFEGRILGNGLENILFGPWAPGSDRLWEKRLADGQSVLVPAPPGADAAAILEIVSIRDAASPQPDHPGISLLAGIISRLTLDPRSGEMLANVTVANMPLMVRLPLEQVKRYNLFPGMPVYAAYRPESVKWV